MIPQCLALFPAVTDCPLSLPIQVDLGFCQLPFIELGQSLKVICTYLAVRMKIQIKVADCYTYVMARLQWPIDIEMEHLLHRADRRLVSHVPLSLAIDLAVTLPL